MTACKDGNMPFNVILPNKLSQLILCINAKLRDLALAKEMFKFGFLLLFMFFLVMPR